MTVSLLVQILISLLLVGAILLQAKGTGLGSAFGGGGEVYRTKRGFERILFTFTIILAAIFVIISLINVIVV